MSTLGVKQKFILGVLIIISVSLLFLWRLAFAASATLVPNSDVTSAWPTCSTTCSAMMQYSYVDEGTSTSVTDWIGTGADGAGGEVVEFGLTTASSVASATQVDVRATLRSATIGSTADTVGFALRVNGALQAVYTVTMTTTWTNYATTFTGNWTQAEVDSMQIYLIRNVVGTGPASGRDDDVQIANTYATLTYTQTVQFEQSAYRWFDNADASSELTFAKTTGGANYDNAYSFAKTSDGGYITTGYTTSYGGGSFDLLLSKYDETGTLSWSRTWGGTGNESGYSPVQTSDGGYIVTGYTTSYGGGGEDMILLKYSSTGTLSWSRTWGSTGADNGRSVVATSDGGFAVTGYTDSYGSGSADMFLAKYTSTGTLSWSRTWGGTGADVAYSLIQTSDGGYAMTGYNVSYGAGNRDMFLTKYDSTGTLNWSRTWGGAGIDYGQGVIQTSDGGFAVTGQTDSYGGGGADMFLAKYDSAGSHSWSRTWGGASNDSGYSLVQTSDGGFAVSGYTISYGSGNEDMFLAKYDASGTHGWSRTFGGTGYESSYKVVLESAGGFTLAGYADSWGSGSADILLARHDSTGSIAGCSGTICRTPTPGTGTPVPSLSSPSAGTSAPTAATSTPSPGTSSPTPSQTVVVAVAPTVDVGSALAVQDTAATAAAQNTVRLRLGLHVTSGQADPGTVSLKLQYVAKGSGTCAAPSGGTPSAYTDVTDSTIISYANNPAAADGQGITANASDPTHSGHAVIRQTYEEANNVGVSTAVAAGQDGLWDFALKDNGAMPQSTYCFRLVKSDGTALSTYSMYPELTTSQAQYEQSAYRVYENAPINGGSTTFAYAHGVSGHADTDVSVFQTTDGGYVTGGYANTGSATIGRLTKYNANSSIAWSKRISYGEQVTIRSAIELDSGEIVAVGASVYDTNDPGAYKSFIAKFSSTGSLIWLRSGARSAFEYDVVEAANGSITAVGHTSVLGGAGSDDAIITNFSATDGTMNWSRLLGGTSSDMGSDIAVLNDGSYVIGGKTQSYTAGGYDAFIASYSSSGTYQWMKTIGEAGSDEVMDISAAPDGGFAVLSNIASVPNVSKHTSSGSVSWSKRISSGTGDYNGIAVTTNGAIVASGFYGLAAETRLAHFDTSGVLSGSSSFSDSGITLAAYDVTDTSDGGFVVVGMANGYYPEDKNLLLKYDSAGEISGCDFNCMDASQTESAGLSYTDRSPVLNTGSEANSAATYTISDASETQVVIISYAAQSSSDIEPGAPLAATNTPATLPSAGHVFRVRALAHMTTKGIPAGVAFKLQFAEKSGSCSTSTGFSDVTASSVVAFYDNANGTTGAVIGTTANDPSHSGHSVVYNAYVESNNFHSMATIPLGADGLWDIALKDNGAPAGTTYCLRMVRSDNSVFETYSNMAEVTTYGTVGEPSGPTLNQQMRGGQSVVDGVKTPFSW